MTDECPYCFGVGEVKHGRIGRNLLSDVEDCPNCNGSGYTGRVCGICGEFDGGECYRDPWLRNASPNQLRDYFQGDC